ncbi:MAG: hypothetical protein HKO10_07115 [Acidimicrobiia bacterium]|nr:hypothetical protein [Acidimicrobiia bacterium]
MNRITAVRSPIRWEDVGFPNRPLFGDITIVTGTPGWSWSQQSPDLPIAVLDDVPAGEVVPGWGVDHVVVTTANLELTVARLTEVGADLRRRTEVKCTPTAFLVCGTLVEVIEASPMDVHLYGVALETDEDLDEVANRWREAGWNAGKPHDAMQSGRRIFSVPDSNLAVMSCRQ